MHGHRVTVAREDAALLHVEKVHPVAAARTQQQWPEPDIVLDRNPDPLDLRTRRAADNETALLAVILADATNLGLSRMAEASQGVTRDQLLWTREAYTHTSNQHDPFHATVISAAEHEAPFVLAGPRCCRDP